MTSWVALGLAMQPAQAAGSAQAAGELVRCGAPATSYVGVVDDGRVIVPDGCAPADSRGCAASAPSPLAGLLVVALRRRARRRPQT